MTKEAKPFDPSKPVETRHGKPARILCVDAKGTQYPVLALVEELPGVEVAKRYTKNGRFFSGGGDSETDLVNVPERVSRWRPVYSNGSIGCLRPYREDPEKNMLVSRKLAGSLRTDFEDGVVVRIEFEKWDDPQKET